MSSKNLYTDKSGYEEFYKNLDSPLFLCRDKVDFTELYERLFLSPYYLGGEPKGYINSQTIKRLVDRTQALNRMPHEMTVVDAGSGVGYLSVYLAIKGYYVIGVEVSEKGCSIASDLAKKFDVSNHCIFLAESLEKTTISKESVDFIIGHGSFHHFIKYEHVPMELKRIMKTDAQGYFSDSFGENKFYSLFHDKERMKRLGDVSLTKHKILEYFKDFEVEMIPMDWLSMFDKFYERVLPKSFDSILRKMSRVHYMVDRKIPSSSRAMLFLSGSIMTVIHNVKDEKRGQL